jgi:hypothetical protein
MHIVNLHGMVISTAPNAHIYSRDLSNCNFIKTNQDTHQRTLDIRFMSEERSRLQSGVNRGATLDQQQQQEAPSPSSSSSSSSSGADSEGDDSSSKPLVAGTIMFGHSAH